MFKIIKDNKIIGVSENEPVLLDKYEVQEDTERTISDYMQVNGEFVLTSSAEAIEQYKAQKRAERDAKIEIYEWRLSRYERQKAINVETTDTEETYLDLCRYIQYLRDITKQDKWWELELKEFEE